MMALTDSLADSFMDQTDPDTIGRANGLPDGLLSKVVKVESGGRAGAVSPKGARGLGQNMPATARDPGFGVAPYDAESLTGSARYLKKMIDLAGGDVNKGLAYYNAGPNGNVDNPETKAYVKKIDYSPSLADSLAETFKAPQQSAMAQSPQAVGAPAQPQSPYDLMVSQETALQGIQDPSSMSQYWRGIGESFTQPYSAAKQAFVHGAAGVAQMLEPNSPLAASLGKKAQEMDQRITVEDARKKSIAEQMGRVTGMGTTLLIPGLGAGGGMLRAMLGSSLTAGAYGALTPTPVRPGENFAANKLEQVATGLVVGGLLPPVAYGVGKGMAGAFGAASSALQKHVPSAYNFLFKTTPSAAPQTAYQNAQAVAQRFMMHDQETTARRLQWVEWLKDFNKTHPDYKGSPEDEELFHAGERFGPQHYAAQGVTARSKLSPKAQYYANLFNPIRAANDKEFALSKKLGVQYPKNFDARTYMHRMAESRDRNQSLMDQIAEAVDPSGTFSPIRVRGLRTAQDITKDVVAGGAADPVTGQRASYIISRTGPQAGHARIMKGGNVIAEGKVQGNTLTTRTGHVWNLTRGTVSDIEKDTGQKYTKSALASLIETNDQLKQINANAQFLKDIVKTPEFRKLAVKVPKNGIVPEGWRKVDIPGFSGFDRYHFDPALAEVLQDWSHTADNPISMLQGMTRIMQGSIFLAPLKHIWNVKGHTMVQAGLFGGAYRLLEGGVRAITPEEQTLSRQAMDAVLNHNEDYMRYLKVSPALRGASVAVQDFSKFVLKSVGKNPQHFDTIAHTLGYASGALFLRGLFRAANKGMWNSGDYMTLKAFLAHEQAHFGGPGMEQEVAKAITAHVPDYQIPSRVIFREGWLGQHVGRGISRTLQAPLIFSFSRYEYNRLASYARMARDLYRPTTASRVEALDQIAAVIFHSAVTYPMLDYATQQLTGNPHASFANVGPFIFPRAWAEYQKGKRTLGQLVSTPFNLSAATESFYELMKNQQWNRKPVYGPGGDFPRWLASKFYPIDALYKIANPRKGLTTKDEVREFAEDFLGIKDPTPGQYAIIEKFARQELARRRRANEDPGRAAAAKGAY